MIRIDPRTKLGLLLIVVIYSIFLSSKYTECLLVAVIMVTGILLGRVWKTVRSAMVFYTIWILYYFFLDKIGGTLHTSLLAWGVLLFKCYPSCMLAMVVVGTTEISEFMAGMSKMKIPKLVSIPLAIVFRYIPVVKEDWSYIRDAMSMRGISPSPIGLIKNPVAVVDAIYVPMLVSASKTADELSVAAITRGIENPCQRSSRLDIKFGRWDIIISLVYVKFIIFCILMMNLW